MTGEITMIQLGLGGVGQALTHQVLACQAALEQRYGFALCYRALVDRSGALVAEQSLDRATIQAALDAKQQGATLATLPQAQRGPINLADMLPDHPIIIVDVTAADGMETLLTAAVAAGHRIVLANKRPLTARLDAFQALTEHGATRYEATVGAGLPVISALQALLDGGDVVRSIEASMSGTLGYLCTALEEGRPLSAAVRIAHENGWTEPDPRDDLSGADVARKALILARTCGLAWEMNDVPGEPWFPPPMAVVSVNEFMQRVGELDADMAGRVTAARAKGMALRYAAVMEPAGASVGLRELPLEHPLATLRGTDNLFSFTTDRYTNQPLVVRGPGAGVDVTAAGVLGDIVATARELSERHRA